MKKIFVLIIVVAIIAVLAFVFLSKGSKVNDIEKPPVVDHFACSDYCPGPEEEYMIKIYQGVEDEEECRQIGGKPSSYTGWGTTKICLAE